MINIKKIVLYTVFTLLCSFSIAQTNKASLENTFGEDIFNCFRKSDFSKLKPLLLSYDEYIDEEVPTMKKDSAHQIPELMLSYSKEFYKSGKIDILNKKNIYRHFG